MTRRRGAIAVLAIGALACAGGEKPGPDGPMQRELTFGEPAELRDAAGTFTATLSIPFEEAEGESGSHIVQVPIQASVPIFCQIWPGGSELGVTAMRTADAIVQSLVAEDHEVSDFRLVRLATGEIGGAPVHTLFATFAVRSEKGAGTGLMKIAAATKHGFGIACNHWDAGYSRTFTRVVDELVSSFRAYLPPPEPFYEEVTRIWLGETQAGVAAETLTRGADGDVIAMMATSLLLPRSETETFVSYTEEVEWSDPTGELTRAVVAESDVRGRSTEIALEWDEALGWAATGVHQGQPVDTALGHPGALFGMLREWQAMRSTLAPHGDRTSVKLQRWLPSVDPTRASEVVLSVDAGDPEHLTVQSGEVVMELERDDEGLPRGGALEVGPVTLRLERIHQRHRE